MGFSPAISLRKFSMVVFRIMESGKSGVSSDVAAPPRVVVLMLMDGRPCSRRHLYTR
uniref:Uncharacterized protein n=1 Tax=Arundo donax TaxID=35708 RepID=A0A0A9CJ59_ARUDO